MIKTGIRNGEIAKYMALIGEGDAVVICGCKMSLPEGVPVVDLAVTDNLPTLDVIADVIISTCMFKECTVAHEIESSLKEKMDVMLSGLKTNELTFRQLQVVTKNTKLVIRTGDMSDAAALVLRV